MNYRSKQWEQWHNKGTNLDYIRSTKNQILQARSIEQITNLKKSKHEYSILEIGPADGYTCYELISNNDNIYKYTLLDDISMLKLSKKQLASYNNINYIEIDDIQSLQSLNFDLLISNHCLEETPKQYQKFVYDTVFPNTNEVFILCNTEYSNVWGKFDIDFLTSNMEKYYKVSILNGHSLSRKSQKIYYGIKS